MSTPLYQIPFQPVHSFGNPVGPLLQEEDVAANVEHAAANTAAHAANIAANIAANTESAAVREELIVAEDSVEDYLEGAFSASGSPITALKQFMTTVTPKDALDVIYNSGNKVGNLYRGYVGERPKISPNATVQPIDQGTRTLSYQPLNANTAYQTSINTVNTRNTPVAQSQYS